MDWNLAGGVAECHWNGLENRSSVVIDKGELHEFGAINRVVVGQIERVVSLSEKNARIFKAFPAVGTAHTTDKIMPFLRSERVEWSSDNALADGFDDAVLRNDNRHVVNHRRRDGSDGIFLVGNVEEQVGRANLRRLAANKRKNAACKDGLKVFVAHQMQKYENFQEKMKKTSRLFAVSSKSDYICNRQINIKNQKYQ